MTLAMVALVATSLFAADAPRPSIQGVWRVVEEKNMWRTIDKPNPGYMIFTEKHFSIVREPQDIERPRGDGLREGHSRATGGHVGTFVAQFGTYEIKDDILTLTIVVAKNNGEGEPQANHAIQDQRKHVNHFQVQFPQRLRAFRSVTE
jgi:hypothetical protein